MRICLTLSETTVTTAEVYAGLMKAADLGLYEMREYPYGARQSR